MEIKLIEKQEASKTISVPSYWTNGLHHYAIISENLMITAMASRLCGSRIQTDNEPRLSRDCKETDRATFLDEYGKCLQMIGDGLNDLVTQKSVAA